MIGRWRRSPREVTSRAREDRRDRAALALPRGAQPRASAAAVAGGILHARSSHIRRAIQTIAAARFPMVHFTREVGFFIARRQRCVRTESEKRRARSAAIQRGEVWEPGLVRS